eukprot:gb/GECG01016320.1/.p1 GENE.gb/GECG01016320.1/~~gb/GECG01016320.1/.p1  ORF type:complete len:1171 (+),score=111.99 gb/GECG01016320.1/:1-3513(+)
MVKLVTSKDESQGLIVLFFGLTLGLFARTIVRRYIPIIPYPVIVLLFGVLLGALELADAGSQLADSVQKWLGLRAILIFVIFLPTLIWHSASNIDYHVFKRALPQVVILALPAVLGGMALLTVVAKFMYSQYQWTWIESLTYAATLAATDPVAVISVLHELGASKPLETRIEGESLLNDASALVAFNIIALHSDELSAGLVFETFFRVSVGGIAVGLLFALLAIKCVSYIYNDSISEVVVTVIAVYGAFILSEVTVLGVSGVLAVVVLGVIMAGHGKVRISSDSERDVHTFWSMLNYLAETAIFILTGIIIVDKTRTDIEPIDWGYMVLGYVMIYLIRAVILGLLYPILSQIGYGMSKEEFIAIAWGGLKGTISLALALIVEQGETFEEEFKRKAQFHVSGIVFLSLLINGSSAKFVLKYLRIGEKSEESQRLFERTTMHLDSQIQEKALHLHGDRFLGEADWKTVWSFIPVHSQPVLLRRILNGRVPEKPERVPRILQNRWRKYIKNFYNQAGSIEDGSDDNELNEKRKRAAHKERKVVENWHDILERGDWWYRILFCRKQNTEEDNTISANNKQGSTNQVYNPVADSDRDRTMSAFSPMSQTDTPQLRSETRQRFIKGVENSYWYRFEHGLIGHRSMTLLTGAEAWQYDRSNEPMAQFSNILSKTFSRGSCLRKLELSSSFSWLSDILRPLTFNAISVQYDVGCNFIAAHEHMIKQASQEWGDHPSARAIAKESAYQVSLAHKRVTEIIEVFPEIVKAVQTQHVVRALLREESHLVHDLKIQGAFDEKEYDKISHEIATSFLKANHFPQVVTEDISQTELREIHHFAALSDAEIEELRMNSQEHFFSAGDNISLSGKSSNDIYVILRGSVDVEVPLLSLETLRNKGLAQPTGKGDRSKAPFWQSAAASTNRLFARSSAEEQNPPLYINQMGAGSLCCVPGVLLDSPRLETVTAETFVKALSIDSTVLLKLARMNGSLQRSLWLAAASILGNICVEKLNGLSPVQVRVALQQSTMYTTMFSKDTSISDELVCLDTKVTLHRGMAVLVVKGGVTRFDHPDSDNVFAVDLFTTQKTMRIRLHSETVAFVLRTEIALEYIEKSQPAHHGSEEEGMESLSNMNRGASGSFVSYRQLSDALGSIDDDEDLERRRSSAASASRAPPPTPARPAPK